MSSPPTPSPGRLLITAGPTHEPIDAVRYLGNRSSGRLGVALADAAAARGWAVTLLLGPSAASPGEPGVRVERFVTSRELGLLLERYQPLCDVLVMAAAVADYRPKVEPAQLAGKLRRLDRTMVLELEPTEDLLAACSRRRSAGQVLVGFALEPRERLIESAREKLGRKGVDVIVANPLDTMESEAIEAVVLSVDGRSDGPVGAVPKAVFAVWLLDLLAERRGRADAGSVR